MKDVVKILDNLRRPINSKERSNRIAVSEDKTLYPYYGATGLVGYIDDFIVSGNYILLGEDGAPFLDKQATKAYIVCGKYWVNNHAHILAPLGDINYLCYYLNQLDYSGYVKGSTRLKLTQADMKYIPILLPPYQEQMRIVSMINHIYGFLSAILKNL